VQGQGPEIFVTTMVTLGPVTLTDSLLTAAGLTLALGLVFWSATRTLRLQPAMPQVIAEAIVLAMETAVREVAPDDYRKITPFVMTLWLFILLANLIGIVPGLKSPTRDLSVTAALAIVVFLSVHWFGIRAAGFKAYLRHYLSPSPILLPFHLISELTRTLALAVRLFGNMMSLGMVALLLLMIAGFLVPIPVLMLHIVEAVVQAYIFGMLALIYIASGVQSRELAAGDADRKNDGEAG